MFVRNQNNVDAGDCVLRGRVGAWVRQNRQIIRLYQEAAVADFCDVHGVILAFLLGYRKAL